MEAIALLQEWVLSIGSQAGLTEHNTTILSGAIGAPESRLEAQTFPSLPFKCIVLHCMCLQLYSSYAVILLVSTISAFSVCAAGSRA